MNQHQKKYIPCTYYLAKIKILMSFMSLMNVVVVFVTYVCVCAINDYRERKRITRNL